MSSIVRASVIIQASPEPVPAVPAWFGEFAVAVPVGCATSVNGTVAPQPNRAKSACCFIRSWSGENPSSGETGVAGVIGERWSSFCVTSASMSNSLKQLHWLSLRLLDCFLARNEHITVSPGLSAWRAMLTRKPLQRSPSGGSRIPDAFAAALGLRVV